MTIDTLMFSVYGSFAIFIVLTALDVITTIDVIESGKGREANPILKYLIDKLGLKPALILSKTALLILVVLCIFFYLDLWNSLGLLTILNAGMGWVVWNNCEVRRAGVR
ncbi:MAG: hypothetical protein A4E69_01871 [Syntrophus sp. PtaB.Bin138]|nr:MAG: hypothetical protein A4E69_01871 [Syntrophus sp. PtaB.Bin138]